MPDAVKKLRSWSSVVCIRVILVFLLLPSCRVHLEKDLRHDASPWTGVIQPLTQSTRVKLKILATSWMFTPICILSLCVSVKQSFLIQYRESSRKTVLDLHTLSHTKLGWKDEKKIYIGYVHVSKLPTCALRHLAPEGCCRVFLYLCVVIPFGCKVRYYNVTWVPRTLHWCRSSVQCWFELNNYLLRGP